MDNNTHCLNCGRAIEESAYLDSNYCEYCDAGIIDDPHGEEWGPYYYEE